MPISRDPRATMLSQHSVETTVALPYGNVDVVQLSPPNAVGGAPVLMLPAFLTTHATLCEHMKELLRCGRPSLAINAHPGLRAESTPPRAFQLVGAHWQRSTAVLHTLDAMRVDRVHAIVHSEAALTVVLAALQRPDQFENVVLVNPAGLVRSENALRLGMSYLLEVANHIAHRMTTARSAIDGELGSLSGREAWRYVRTGYRGMPQQILGLAGAEGAPWIRTLRERAPHIGLGLLHAKRDCLFPWWQVKKAALQAGVDRVQAMQGPHDTFLLEPQRTIRKAEEVLRGLEGKRS